MALKAEEAAAQLIRSDRASSQILRAVNAVRVEPKLRLSNAGAPELEIQGSSPNVTIGAVWTQVEGKPVWKFE
jgi:hypothetical protein